MKWFYLTVLACLLITQTWAKTLEHEDDEQDDPDVAGGYDNVIADPCRQKQCGPGKECDLDEERKPVCVCVHKCPPETQESSKVCSTHNVTFDSECELYRQKCLCHRGHAECRERRHKKAHLDYYGSCKEITECTEEEMEEYPERMRTWLYLVMEELARREDLSEPARRMAQEAERRPKKWVLPVIWKFCDLDESHDMQMSAHELLAISAQLKPLEHCTGPFLVQCDSDQSGYISLHEWGKCLGLEDDEIEDRCQKLRT